MEVVVASSSVDAGVGCWDLNTGAEQLRYKSCASPPHGLVCVGNRFLASSQHRDTSASTGSVLYWSWSKPQVEVKSPLQEKIKPLAATREGTYIVGGGSSGSIYLWEVASSRMLKKWPAHYRGVTCLVFSDDDSLLISGSEDGSVKVWSLLMIFDDYRRERSHLYEHSFSEHNLCVTDIVAGYGGCNAIIVSASEDRTCKVWSLSKGKLLRNIVFPTIIDAIALDPAEHVFYAGGRDGKIYVAALNAESPSSKNHGLHIISAFSNHSKAVTCLQYGINGNLLISGSEDGMIRVWDARTQNIIRVFKHAKGPVNNIIVVSQPLYHFQMNVNPQSSRKQGLSLKPLEKYEADGERDSKTIIGFQMSCSKSTDAMYVSSRVIDNQIKELQQKGSVASEMEMERLKLDCKRSAQMVEQWKKMYGNLHQFCLNELLDGSEAGGPNGNSS
ncbi:hypothetical protein UlMin_035045 [Ulmus minor]